jgi:2-succinyl-5-enolpyruvyl-6-hydroxy-3-cyclohexene-1-carboxylate synthase
VFEEWFGTPPNLDFRPAVEMYGGDYVRADDWGAFRNAIAGPRRRGLQVVEVRTDRARNAVLHREAWSAACAAAWGSEEAPK